MKCRYAMEPRGEKWVCPECGNERRFTEGDKYPGLEKLPLEYCFRDVRHDEPVRNIEDLCERSFLQKCEERFRGHVFYFASTTYGMSPQLWPADELAQLTRYVFKLTATDESDLKVYPNWRLYGN